jgi:hypothetical protein
MAIYSLENQVQSIPLTPSAELAATDEKACIFSGLVIEIKTQTKDEICCTARP